MHILLRVAGHVKVDHMLHFGDVETSGSSRGPYYDWGLAAFEPPGNILIGNFYPRERIQTSKLPPFMLSSVSVDGGDGEALSVEELVQGISSTLRLHKDQGP